MNNKRYFIPKKQAKGIGKLKDQKIEKLENLEIGFLPGAVFTKKYPEPRIIGTISSGV